MNSPLKWAGSKRWQVPMLKERLGFIAQGLTLGTRRLVEPFCGGLNIALGLEPKYAVLNDVNPWLMNFWRCLQLGAPFELDELAPGSYFIIRSAFNLLTTSGQADMQLLRMAEYFYALNQWAFNGLYRVNSRGEFNVPPRPVLKPLQALDVIGYQKALENWSLYAGDYQEIWLAPGDLIYADPPYDDGFTGYSAGKFTWDDQQRLAQWLAAHTGPVVAMNKATRRVQQLYFDLGFEIELIDAPQRMHHAMGSTDETLEMMATKL